MTVTITDYEAVNYDTVWARVEVNSPQYGLFDGRMPLIRSQGRWWAYGIPQPKRGVNPVSPHEIDNMDVYLFDIMVLEMQHELSLHIDEVQCTQLAEAWQPAAEGEVPA